MVANPSVQTDKLLLFSLAICPLKRRPRWILQVVATQPHKSVTTKQRKIPGADAKIPPKKRVIMID